MCIAMFVKLVVTYVQTLFNPTVFLLLPAPPCVLCIWCLLLYSLKVPKLIFRITDLPGFIISPSYWVCYLCCFASGHFFLHDFLNSSYGLFYWLSLLPFKEVPLAFHVRLV